MRQPSRRSLSFFLGVSLLSLGLLSQSAKGDLIGTEQILSPAQANQERERVKALTARQDVAKELQAMGISPELVQARIDAMTDAEVHAIAGKLNSLPAGGMTDFQFIIVILLTVIVVILIL
jgi:uncharacterized protein DUF6627